METSHYFRDFQLKEDLMTRVPGSKEDVMPKKSRLFDDVPVEEVKEEQVVEEKKEEAPVEEEVKEEPVVEEKKPKMINEFGRVVGTQLLNVRKSPNGEILKTIKANEQVTIYGVEGDWYMIDNGYVMKQYIQKI